MWKIHIYFTPTSYFFNYRYTTFQDIDLLQLLTIAEYIIEERGKGSKGRRHFPSHLIWNPKVCVSHSCWKHCMCSIPGWVLIFSLESLIQKCLRKQTPRNSLTQNVRQNHVILLTQILVPLKSYMYLCNSKWYQLLFINSSSAIGTFPLAQWVLPG